MTTFIIQENRQPTHFDMLDGRVEYMSSTVEIFVDGIMFTLVFCETTSSGDKPSCNIYPSTITSTLYILISDEFCCLFEKMINDTSLEHVIRRLCERESFSPLLKVGCTDDELSESLLVGLLPYAKSARR